MSEWRGGVCQPTSRGDAGAAWCPQPRGTGSATTIPIQPGGHGGDQGSPSSALPLLSLLLDPITCRLQVSFLPVFHPLQTQLEISSLAPLPSTPREA